MDRIDEEIIRCVVANARSTYAEIGKAAGLSPSAAKRRLDRLVAAGAIRGFTAIIDPQALAWRTEAYVQIHCAGNPTPAQLRQELEKIPEVIEACTISGAADAMIHLQAEGIAHLEQAIQRMRTSPVIGSTESVIALSRLISRPRM
ncbi:Lrp/AsnC family transcriptional regulator [Micromonospora sp. NPDC051006]|uniref:Lrp/AsnC family transcriptional regulator n=1 Tax=Micromonospora sp. NPDC051006 TaxID=3364283 RepID=UPI00378BA545